MPTVLSGLMRHCHVAARTLLELLSPLEVEPEHLVHSNQAQAPLPHRDKLCVRRATAS